MKCKMFLVKNQKSAFTLIELLVVISIIALLLAILMPSLQKAKLHAKRVVCSSNMKSQYLSQMGYAADNDSKFAPHYNFMPNWFMETYTAPGGPAGLDHMLNYYKDYIGNLKIFHCPALTQLGRFYKDITYEDPSVEPGGGVASTRDHREAAYSWYANFRTSYTVTFSGKPMVPIFDFSHPNTGVNVREPAWPNDGTECNSRKAFISHDITSIELFGGSVHDAGHGSQEEWLYGVGFDLSAASKSEATPIAFADGHIENRLKSKMKLRAWHYYKIAGSVGKRYYLY